MPKRSRATLKGLALAKLQRLNGAAYRGHPLGSGQFDCGRIVNWKTDCPGRILGACRNPIIDPVNAARFMTAASTW